MKKALRTGKIEIDTQKINEAQWIVATIQSLDLDNDNKILSEDFRDGKIFKKVTDVALETVTITDPVTQQEITLSVAGLGTAIKAILIKWILEENPNSTYDAEIGMVIK